MNFTDIVNSNSVKKAVKKCLIYSYKNHLELSIIPLSVNIVSRI